MSGTTERPDVLQTESPGQADLPPALVDRFAGLRAVVLGDAMLDTYYSGTSRRLCQEAPVPIVDVQRRRDMPGGAGNCAANLAALGATVSLVAAVGEDPEGALLRRLLQEAGVSTEHILPCAERRTLSKARLLADRQMLARLDQGSTGPVEDATERAFGEAIQTLYPRSDVVLVSDYGYGVLTPGVISRLAGLQAASPKVLVVDSKSLPAFAHVGMTACKPNYQETLRMLGAAAEAGEGRTQTALRLGPRVLEATGARIVAVTLDHDGALVFHAAAPPHRTSARSMPADRAAGAGDTYLSVLALALAAEMPIAAAAELAAAAAAVAVSKEHTATCSADELRQYLAGTGGPHGDLAWLLGTIEEHRRHHRRIVLTNGCFDILHCGHIRYLEQAKRLGDVLVVGVNTDQTIRRLKGPSRPINTLADRIGVLAALNCVDHVVAFEEDTPHRLIQALRPDVFVKGGDYTRQTLPEASLVEQLGGTVKILPLVPGRSTSGLVDRIRRTSARNNPGATPAPLPSRRSNGPANRRGGRTG